MPSKVWMGGVFLSLVLLLGISPNPLAATSSGSYSVNLLQGTDHEFEMTFTWEIDHTFWMAGDTYDVRLGRYMKNIGGNNFQGTYAFYLGVENITTYSMFMGGSVIVTEPSIITKPLALGSLEPNYYLETFVRVKLVVNDDTHGTDIVDERMFPIIVIGPVVPSSSSESSLTQNTTTTTTTITQSSRSTPPDSVPDSTADSSTSTTTKPALSPSWTFLLFLFVVPSLIFIRRMRK